MMILAIICLLAVPPVGLGTSGASPTTQPHINGITSRAPSVGGKTLSINGRNLGGTTIVHFGTTWSSTTITNNTTTSLTVVSPAQSPGLRRVWLTATGGRSNTVTITVYTNKPHITSITPPTGLFTGGQTITIFGQYLGGTRIVQFGTTWHSTTIADNTTTEFTVVTPPQAVGSRRVWLTATNGRSNTVTWTAGGCPDPCGK